MPNLDLEALKMPNDLSMFAQGTEINLNSEISSKSGKTIDPMFILKKEICGSLLILFHRRIFIICIVFAAIGAAVDKTDSQQFMTLCLSF